MSESILLTSEARHHQQATEKQVWILLASRALTSAWGANSELWGCASGSPVQSLNCKGEEENPAEPQAAQAADLSSDMGWGCGLRLQG